MLIIFTLFVPFQIGLYILFGISLLANVNLVESEFVLSAIGFTVPAIVGIICFRKEIIESFTYFKEKTILKNSKYSYGSFIYVNCGTVCYVFSSNWSTREPRDSLKRVQRYRLYLHCLYLVFWVQYLKKLCFATY